ncbi:hypothetical protein [Streptomyces sp. NPDC051109]|uniref:hypothetical protein n=1 Tax=Streptomyces sp. NPDC051109 TaxID=3365642 RepID=UPI0037A69ECC
MNGLAFSVPFDGQGELLRQLAQEAVTPILIAACSASASALSHVDAAVAMLGRHSTFSNELILEQYLVKRDAIQEARLRAPREAEHEVRRRRQDAANAELERAMHRSSVRAVELVAVFTSAIAFVIGSLQVTLNGNLKLRERLWLLTGVPRQAPEREAVRRLIRCRRSPPTSAARCLRGRRHPVRGGIRPCPRASLC